MYIYTHLSTLSVHPTTAFIHTSIINLLNLLNHRPCTYTHLLSLQVYLTTTFKHTLINLLNLLNHCPCPLLHYILTLPVNSVTAFIRTSYPINCLCLFNHRLCIYTNLSTLPVYLITAFIRILIKLLSQLNHCPCTCTCTYTHLSTLLLYPIITFIYTPINLFSLPSHVPLHTPIYQSSLFTQLYSLYI